MKSIFVSGCYDILHAGHVQFFTEARALGDRLIVCFASDEVLWKHKHRRSSLPQEHKRGLIEGLSMVDEVVIGERDELGLDFKDHFLRLRPDVLAVTEDDQYGEAKRALCAQAGAEYVILPKTPPQFPAVSTSGIVRWIRAPEEAPLRVDFGGGWLDVPRYAREGAFVVNCAISPLVSLRHWDYEKRAGLGGSGAWALLNGEDGVNAELGIGVGWQDPAVIFETGLCVWRSGPRPILRLKRDGEVLAGRMAVLWTGKDHDTPGAADNRRDYDAIEAAGRLAAEAVEQDSLLKLGEAVAMSYGAQLAEGMATLPEAAGCLGRKYCGGGWGGYALYLFDSRETRDVFVSSGADARAIEPFIRVAGSGIG